MNEQGTQQGEPAGQEPGVGKAYDWLYERHQAPFLALCRGRFGFLHTSPDRVSGVAVRDLSLAPLGRLKVPHGSVVMGDPFRGLKPAGNVRYTVPPGEHPVIQTLARVGEDERIAAIRTAYLSVVFEPELIQQRQDWQRQAMAAGKDPALDRPFVLRPATVCLPEGSFSEEETRRLLEPGMAVLTGFMAMADAESFEAHMPLNRAEIGQGWLETLFEHGVEGSWFDQLDSDAPWPKGTSNHPLPGEDGQQANVVVCQTGWGDGRYRAFLETIDGQVAALHVDFQVIPRDPMQEWR